MKLFPMSTGFKIALPIAAFVLVVIIYRVTYTSYNERLYAEHYKKADSVYFAKSRGDDTAYLIKQKAFELYQQGNLEKSQEELNQLPEVDEEQQFLFALILLEQKKYEEAIPFLKAAQAIEQTREQATWYLGLTYLVLSRNEESKMEFEKIKSSDQFFFDLKYFDQHQ